MMAMLRILSMGRILEIEEREYGGDHGSRQLAVASRSARGGFGFSSRRQANHWKSDGARSRLALFFSFRAARPMKRYLPFAIVLGVFLIAAGAGVYFIQQRRQQPPPISGAGVPGAEPPHAHGPANARVSLEEFGDFECMPCYMLFPVLKNLEKDYGDNVSFTFREHPLAQHRNALEAARAAEAAGLQEQFWQMHDKLYLNRSVWVPALDVRGYLTTYATYLGLDAARFKKDMDGEEVARRIKADQARGASLGVDRTPVVFINGQKIAFGSSPEADMRAAIDKALAEKREH
jgi:protein-disulfide isomerase